MTWDSLEKRVERLERDGGGCGNHVVISVVDASELGAEGRDRLCPRCGRPLTFIDVLDPFTPRPKAEA